MDALLLRSFVREASNGAYGEKHLLEVWPLTDVALDLELVLARSHKANEEVVRLVRLARVVFNLAPLAMWNDKLILELLRFVCRVLFISLILVLNVEFDGHFGVQQLGDGLRLPGEQTIGTRRNRIVDRWRDLLLARLSKVLVLIQADGH